MSGASAAISAAYACDLCGAEAGRIEARPDGARIAVTVTGVSGTMTVWRAADDLPRAEAAMRGGLRTLYDYDAEWASFYCPACARAYCRKHWRLEMQFEHDHLPGWYDFTYGTCPEGHRRIVDD